MLSGTGSDGTVGAREVNDAGGLVLVQDPEEARFDSMPWGAIRTGHADVIDAAANLAVRIPDLLLFPATIAESAATDTRSDLEQVRHLILRYHELDIGGYKPSVVMRRVDRRAGLTQSESRSAYIETLEADRAELERLFFDLLITVTSFFRDKKSWDALEHSVLPRLVSELSAEQPELRMWCVACSTGEEAYSLAMLAHEAMEAAGKTPHIRIFATDVNPRALDIASSGIYPISIRATIGPARTARYFDITDAGYRIKPEIRRHVVFAPHDVTQQTPFSHMHLVSCRNMLIYMQPPLQRQVLHTLHRSLRVGGVLFLGAAEGPLDLADYVSAEEDGRLLRKTRLAPSTGTVARYHTRHAALQARATPVHEPVPSFRPTDAMLATVLQAVLADAEAFGVIVSQSNAVMHVVGEPAHWFRPHSGSFENVVTQLLPRRLALSALTALHRARSERRAITISGVDFETNTGIEVADLKVVPGPERPGLLEADYVIVTPHRGTLTPLSEPFDEAEISAGRISLLERELQQTRENLLATIEELETTTEQQQASNEELLAANEELQSTNEELHSVNEELHTVNAEFQEKITELVSLNADLDGLLDGLDVGVVFLDSQLRVRRFNPPSKSVFRLEHADIGRHFLDIANAFDDLVLAKRFHQALQAGEPWSRIVPGESSSWRISITVVPQHAGGGRLVTVVDIDDLERDRRLASELAHQLQLVTDSSPAALFHILPDGTYAYISPNYERLWDLTVNEVQSDQNLWLERLHPDDRERVVQELGEGYANGHFDLSYRVVHRDGTELALRGVGTRLTSSSGEDQGMVGLITDETHNRALQHDLERSIAERELLLTSLDEATYEVDPQSGQQRWLGGIGRLLGYSLTEANAPTNGRLAVVHPADLDRVEAILAAPESQEKGYDICYRVRHRAGHYRWVRDRATYQQVGSARVLLGVLSEADEDLHVAVHRTAAPFADDLGYSVWQYEHFGSREFVVHSTPSSLLSEALDATRALLLDRLERAPRDGTPFSFELELPGTQRLHVRGAAVPRGGYQLLAGLVWITRREDILHDLIEQLPARVSVRDDTNKIVLSNAASRRWHQIDGDELFVSPPFESQDTDALRTLGDAVRRKREHTQQRARRTSPDGEERVFDVWRTPLTGTLDGHILATEVDITDHHRTELALRKRVNVDPLTGLSTRAVFVERLGHAVKRCSRRGEPGFVMIFLDLDGFKEVNDSYGHLVGDGLLREVARRLQTLSRPGDTVARFGGDEFALLLENISGYRDALKVAERIHAANNEPVTIDARRLFVTASIGIAEYDEHYHDVGALLRDADIAMYHAKGLGPAKTAVFNTDMQVEVLRRTETKNDLREAIERGEFVLHAQPLYAPHAEPLTGAELLVRWQHPVRGLLPPGLFLPLAREAGLMGELERWILFRALSYCDKVGPIWQGDAPFRIHVNVGDAAIGAAWFDEWVAEAAARQEAYPVQFVVEMVEDTLLSNQATSGSRLMSARHRGIQVAIDDFGTGYSSLSYLFRYDIDVLKVDRAFAARAHLEDRTGQIVSALVGLCRELDIEVVLEGIETTEQLSYARALRVDGLQGYLLDRPMPCDDLLTRIKAGYDG